MITHEQVKDLANQLDRLIRSQEAKVRRLGEEYEREMKILARMQSTRGKMTILDWSSGDCEVLEKAVEAGPVTSPAGPAVVVDEIPY